MWKTSSENNINSGLKKNNTTGFRHIASDRPTTWRLRIMRERKSIFSKSFEKSKFLLEDVVKYRNEEVYPQFGIKIDDLYNSADCSR
jgi:hypothetical protein